MIRPRRYRFHGHMPSSQRGNDSKLRPARRRPCKFFFTNAKCLKGDSCPYSHDLLEIGFCAAAVEWLEVQWLSDRKFFQKMALDHPVEKWFTQRCSFHNRGYCDRGMLCTFIHDEGDENFNGNLRSASSLGSASSVAAFQSPQSQHLDPATAAFTPSTTSTLPSSRIVEGSKVLLFEP
jgi:hypothetical protein